MNTLITNNVHRRFEGPPEIVSAALRRLEPVQPLRDAVSAFGLAHRVTVGRTQLSAVSADSLSFSLAWLLADESPARVEWALSVTPFADDGSLVSASVRAGTDSVAGDRHLLAAWPLLGQIVESLTTRLLDAVGKLAEELEEDGLERAAVPLRAAA